MNFDEFQQLEKSYFKDRAISREEYKNILLSQKEPIELNYNEFVASLTKEVLKDFDDSIVLDKPNGYYRNAISNRIKCFLRNYLPHTYERGEDKFDKPNYIRKVIPVVLK